MRVDAELTTARVSFTGGGGLLLDGTVLTPRDRTPRRGLVLVCGSGRGPRECLLTEARAFARLGLAA